MSETVALPETKSSLWYWKIYYHLLFYLHFILGILGVVIGALIAADFGTDVLPIGQKGLGVISAVIVGIVSFLQPGRMASVFYDAYWRLRIAVLRSHSSSEESDELIDALANGYSTVATIQPEAIRKQHANAPTLDLQDLSEERRTKLTQMHSDLVEEEKAETKDKITASDDT